MSNQTLGILIGGILPAFIFGITNMFVKASNQAGIGPGPYMISAGLGLLLIGAIVLLLTADHSFSQTSVLFAVGVGLMWGLGIGMVAIAMNRYHTPISKLVPLFNMNTLISVLLALWIFAEWKQVHVGRLIIGAILIVIGGSMVAI